MTYNRDKFTEDSERIASENKRLYAEYLKH